MLSIYPIQDSRPSNWLRLVRGPRFVAPDGTPVQADKAWMDKRVAEYRRLTSAGYVVPVITGHDAALTDQRALGDVLDMTVAEVDGELELVVAVAWNDETVPADIASRKIKYVSPSFSSYTDERGESYVLVLSEVSITARPHRKGAATHILMSEAVMPDSTVVPDPASAPALPSTEERIVSLEAAITDLTEGFAGLQTMLQDLVEAKTDPEEPAETPPANSPPAEATAAPPTAGEIKMAEANAKLNLQLQEAERNLAVAKRAERRASFDLRYPVGAVIEMTEASRDLFFTLAEASPEAINALTIQAVKPGAEGQPAGPPHRSSVPWGIAMGESAHTPTPAIESDGELLTRLRKETGSAGAALEQFKRLRG